MTNIEVLIDRQIKKWELEKKAREEQQAPKQKEVLPIITVSRERGSSGSFLARRLAEEFEFQLAHRQVIDIICSNSGFRRRVVEALDEKTKSQIESWVEGLMHDHYVDSSDYFKHLHHTIIALARHGGLVVVGRGANFVLTLQTGFHIRVVAPERRRVERIMEFANLDKKAAQNAIDKSDEERAEFIKDGFGYDINDPHYYDLVINTGFIDIEDAVQIAIEAIGKKFEKLRRS